MRRRTKIGIGCGVFLAVIALGLAIAYVVIDEPRPRGRTGGEAEALAQRIERAANVEAWQRTGAVRWTFAGRNRHLWDRRRDFARVSWDDVTGLIRVGGPNGRAYRGGREVHGDDAREILEEAWARWVNDSFWLNPIAKLRDRGVTLSTVRIENGQKALLASYSSGGLTPGDAYLWIVGRNDLPRAWRMWVSVLPVGGVEASWERWATLSTGAKIATLHRGAGGMSVAVTDLEGASTLEELVRGPDPFAPLAQER